MGMARLVMLDFLVRELGLRTPRARRALAFGVGPPVHRLPVLGGGIGLPACTRAMPRARCPRAGRPFDAAPSCRRVAKGSHYLRCPISTVRAIAGGPASSRRGPVLPCTRAWIPSGHRRHRQGPRSRKQGGTFMNERGARWTGRRRGQGTDTTDRFRSEEHLRSLLQQARVFVDLATGPARRYAGRQARGAGTGPGKTKGSAICIANP